MVRQMRAERPAEHKQSSAGAAVNNPYTIGTTRRIFNLMREMGCTIPQ